MDSKWPWCEPNKVAPLANVNATIEIRSLVSRGPRTFCVSNGQRRAAFSGNTSLFATFSSFALLGRPTLLCRRTYILPVFLLSSYFRRLISEQDTSSLNRTQSKSATWSEVSVIWKRMSEIYAIHSPYKSGPKTTFLGRLRNLTAILTASVFGMKRDIDNQSSALTTTRGLLYRLKMSWTLVHKRLQTRPAFLSTLHKFRFLLHC